MRHYRVFVAVANQRCIIEDVVDVCRNEECYKWTKEEIEYQMKNRTVFKPRFNPGPIREEGSIYRVLLTVAPNAVDTNLSANVLQMPCQQLNQLYLQLLLSPLLYHEIPD